MLKKMASSQKSSIAQRTQLAFIGMRILGTPFWCLLSILVFILYKHTYLNPLHITFLVALKPASSLLSPYWSHVIYQRPDKLVPNLIGANFFRHLPFLFVPCIHSSWFIIAAFGIYMMLTRATIPAWMEVLKYNLPKTQREQMVSYGTTIDYIGTAVFSLVIGVLLDRYPDSWRFLFAVAAGLGMISTYFLNYLSFNTLIPSKYSVKEFEIKEKVFKPWKQVWNLIRENRAFTLFQGGFMLGGAGLMIMQPALPKLFIDHLHLSFVEMGLAVSVCKAIGVALTSPVWTRLFRKVNIFYFSALVTFCAGLFPFLLLGTSWHVILLYGAYALYGMMQAGSELSWHMSGLVFAQEKDSSTFSITNILTVGIRGCIVPMLGGILLSIMQPLGVLLVGAFLCFAASIYFSVTSSRLQRRSCAFSKVYS